MQNVRFLTEAEKEALTTALNCRKNIVETGSYSLSGADVQRMGEKSARQHGAEVRALSTDQMKLLILTEELQTAILQSRIVVINN